MTQNADRVRKCFLEKEENGLAKNKANVEIGKRKAEFLVLCEDYFCVT